MKATTKLFMMLLVVAGILTFSSCNKYKLPEKITVYGQVTDKDGQLWEGVSVEVSRAQFMGMTIPVEDTHTDENGFYEISFKPNKENTYGVTFQVMKDDYQYYHNHSLDLWEAEQEYNVVLKKYDE